MSTSNRAAPATIRRPAAIAALPLLVLHIPVNLARWIAALVRAPRAQLPGVSPVAIAAFIAVVAIIIGSMFLFDAEAMELARRGPLWLRGFAREITDFGRSSKFLYPLGFVLLVLGAVLSPWLSKLSEGVVAALAVRFGFLFVAIGLPSAFTAIVKGLIGRARPFVGGHDDPFAYMPFVWKPAYASMPSAHATTAAAAAVGISLLFPRLRVVMAIYMLVIMASRILISAHHPSDVLGGAVVGVVGVLMVRRWFAARRLGFSPTDLQPYRWPSWARLKATAREIVSGRPAQ